MNRNTVRPSILIFKEADADPERLKELCSGIEEEGVPYSVMDLPVEDELAARNPLETCVLLFRNRVELRFRRLKSRPLFRIDFNEDNMAGACRTLGKNAARLVKSRPFELE